MTNKPLSEKLEYYKKIIRTPHYSEYSKWNKGIDEIKQDIAQAIKDLKHSIWFSGDGDYTWIIEKIDKHFGEFKDE